jgi:hypothetical protein
VLDAFVDDYLLIGCGSEDQVGLNSWEITEALIELGFEGRKNNNAWAIWLKREDLEKPIYVKKGKNNKSVKRAPLVIHPVYENDRAKLLEVVGCRVDFRGYKSSSLDEFPKASTGTNYGFAINVADKNALAKLVACLSIANQELEEAIKDSPELDLKLVTPPPEDAIDSDLKVATTSERDALIKVRYGQGRFRDLLTQQHGMRCWMSGVESRALLIASHIKPWSLCHEDQSARGNPNNGLLLSALWDAAFDAGLVSFDERWRVITSPEIEQQGRYEQGLDDRSVLPEEFRNDERRKFLAFHRSEIFRSS